jgi:hypothetical protein
LTTPALAVTGNWKSAGGNFGCAGVADFSGSFSRSSSELALVLLCLKCGRRERLPVK